jgi:Dolichyl-phosphate-mannose-protein mannosyltransferase
MPFWSGCARGARVPSLPSLVRDARLPGHAGPSRISESVTPPSTTTAASHDQRLVLRLIGVATALRLAAAAILPLGVDESYAVVVSRTPSLSYFDHPPAVFWLARAAGALGGESPIALRWPFVMLFALTSWLLYRLTARLFSPRAGFWAVVAAQCIPVFSLSSGSWVLPDGPLLCASVAAALALSVAAEVPTAASTHPTPGWTVWLLLGMALGVAGLSKYHAALFGAGAIIFVLTDATARRTLARPQPYVAVAIAACCVAPVFIWNAAHDWASFRFQAGRAASQGSMITALLQNLAGQAGYILPWFWGTLVVLLARGLRGGPRHRAVWFCCCLGALPVFVFTLASLGGRAGLPHWPAPGFFMLLPLLGAAIARWEERAPAVAMRRMRLAAGVFVGLVVIVVSHASTGWVARLVPSLHRRDPAFELLTYRSLQDTLRVGGTLSRARYVATTDWMRGAKIGYALGPDVAMMVLNPDARHFRYVVDTAALTGADGLVLMPVRMPLDTAAMRESIAPYQENFDALRFVRTIPVLRGADTAITVALFTAGSFHAAGGASAP